MDGNAVSRAIREELAEPLMPIIMVTGQDASSALEAGLQAGANDFVSKPFDPTELIARVRVAIKQKRLTDQLDTAESVLFAMARMVEAKDTHTAEHCTRLVKCCQVFGKALGLSPMELDTLSNGAVLHDIGKLWVPDHILTKPDRLDTDEWAVMSRHPVIGAQLCGGLNSVRHAVPIIRHHHERWDGSGYPDGLAGEEIPLLARIFQLADIYDALRHHRPYCGEMPVEHVIEALEHELERGWRDPALTAVFLDILRQRPGDLELKPSDAQGPGAMLFEQIVS